MTPRSRAFLAQGDAEVEAVFEHLAIADIQAAADQLRAVYDLTQGRDGFVSLEVSPYLAMDTEATVAEARRLWAAVDRPNLMVKVPGTGRGVPAIRTLIGEGINVNVTLLFSLRGLSGGGRGPYRRAGGAAGRRRRHRARSPASPASSSAASTARSTRRSTRA